MDYHADIARLTDIIANQQAQIEVLDLRLSAIETAKQSDAESPSRFQLPHD